LTTAFSRFDSINIAAELKPDQTADYALGGLIEFNRDGTAVASFRLRDVADGTLAWSRTFDRLATTGDHTLDDRLVGTLATALVQPFGVLQSRERAKDLAGVKLDPRYRCILLAEDALRSYDPAQHVAAHACLERLTALDKSFAQGFTFLSAMYGAE